MITVELKLNENSVSGYWLPEWLRKAAKLAEADGLNDSARILRDLAAQAEGKSTFEVLVGAYADQLEESIETYGNATHLLREFAAKVKDLAA